MELSGAAVYYFDPDVSGEISIVDLIPYLGSALKKDDVGAAYKAEMTDLASVAAAEVAADPDVILVITGSDDEAERTAIIESYADNPLWAGLSATQNGTIVALPYLVNPNLSTAVDMMNLTKDALIEAAE